MSEQSDYHLKRARQEAAIARQSTDSVAARVHRELAALHEQRAQTPETGPTLQAG